MKLVTPHNRSSIEEMKAALEEKYIWRLCCLARKKAVCSESSLKARLYRRSWRFNLYWRISQWRRGALAARRRNGGGLVMCNVVMSVANRNIYSSRRNGAGHLTGIEEAGVAYCRPA